jgi:hypothetical protein
MRRKKSLRVDRYHNTKSKIPGGSSWCPKIECDILIKQIEMKGLCGKVQIERVS